MKKPLKVKLIAGATILVIVGALARAVSPGTVAQSNVAQTAPHHANPKLRTRRYPSSHNASSHNASSHNASSHNAPQRIEDLMPTLRTYGRAWKLKSSSTRNNITTIVCEVPVFFFTDDLIVTIRSEKNYFFVDVRSSSRVGKSDLGENRRHVLQLLEQLDKIFAKSKN